MHVEYCLEKIDASQSRDLKINGQVGILLTSVRGLNLGVTS